MLAVLIGVPVAAVAHDPGRVDEPKERRAAPQAQPAIDPLVQALLIGLAASVLREAAASPDPIATMGESIERKLAFALRSPEFARVLDRLIADAVKEAPLELREPLAQFAVAMVNNLRREMLDRQARKTY
jgi:hypothetical protein